MVLTSTMSSSFAAACASLLESSAVLSIAAPLKAPKVLQSSWCGYELNARLSERKAMSQRLLFERIPALWYVSVLNQQTTVQFRD